MRGEWNDNVWPADDGIESRWGQVLKECGAEVGGMGGGAEVVVHGWWCMGGGACRRQLSRRRVGPRCGAFVSVQREETSGAVLAELSG